MMRIMHGKSNPLVVLEVTRKAHARPAPAGCWQGEGRMSDQRKVALDVDMNVRIDANGVLAAKLVQVRDATGGDRTEHFREYATQGGFNLGEQAGIEQAAAEYAKKFESLLP
ncbi:hypothetical protein [Burkholderia cenocepacia]|uniref:hypothetical protein n=1 Tax=Burkholderia cenocepacia TaxID=95486 RepID=UPI0026594580|nr:hypothetical protein [Burkholderia cenocepacia]